MALDSDTTHKIVAHLQRTWTAKTCPMCNQNKWEIAGHVTLMLADQPGLMTVGGPYVPCVAAVCLICGNTLLINMAVLGLVEPK